MKHKGIIFDMDGTLWDSAENVAKSWNKAIADYGYERAPITKEDMYSVMERQWMYWHPLSFLIVLAEMS